MTTKSQTAAIKLIRDSFRMLADDDELSRYVQTCFDLALQEEKDYRRFTGGPWAISKDDAAMMFVIRNIVQEMRAEKPRKLTDILRYKPSCPYAAATAQKYSGRIAAILTDFDLDAIEALDYCKLIEGTA